jgi:intracellular sulfur oxidation DsrE/DsrF family protein
LATFKKHLNSIDADMKNIFVTLSLFGLSIFSFGQTSNSDSVSAAHIKDSLRMAKFFSLATYPLIKNSKRSGVIPVNDIDEKADPSIQYKLLMEVTLWSNDSAERKEINGGLAEVGRLINLHIAAGIPKDNIHAAIIIHGAALNVFLSNDAYQKKFKTNNPNLDILKQFSALGIKLIACGQAMAFFNFEKKDMIPEVKTSLSAKVVLSTYQMKGYALYEIKDDK